MNRPNFITEIITTLIKNTDCSDTVDKKVKNENHSYGKRKVVTHASTTDCFRENAKEKKNHILLASINALLLPSPKLK